MSAPHPEDDPISCRMAQGTHDGREEEQFHADASEPGRAERMVPAGVTLFAELMQAVVESRCIDLAELPHDARIQSAVALQAWWIGWRETLNAITASAVGGSFAAANADGLSLQMISPLARMSRGSIHVRIQRYRKSATNSVATLPAPEVCNPEAVARISASAASLTADTDLRVIAPLLAPPQVIPDTRVWTCCWLSTCVCGRRDRGLLTP